MQVCMGQQERLPLLRKLEPAAGWVLCESIHGASQAEIGCCRDQHLQQAVILEEQLPPAAAPQGHPILAHSRGQKLCLPAASPVVRQARCGGEKSARCSRRASTTPEPISRAGTGKRGRRRRPAARSLGIKKFGNLTRTVLCVCGSGVRVLRGSLSVCYESGNACVVRWSVRERDSSQLS